MSKLQLQQELRELMRGQPRKSISTMRVHELEKEIDFIRNYMPKRELQNENVQIPPKPSGPLGPRKMTIHEEVHSDDDQNVVRVPQVAPKRPTEYQMKKASRLAREAPEGEFLQHAESNLTKSANLTKNVTKNVTKNLTESNLTENLTRNLTKPAPKVVRKPAKVVRNDESVNPELVRMKSKPAVYEPVCPKCGSDKYHIH